MSSPVATTVGGNKRVKSTSGCIGCRLRRKKCSLEKPGCVSCLRNGILCTWPDAGNSDHARLLRRTNPRRGQPSKSPNLTPVDNSGAPGRQNGPNVLLHSGRPSPLHEGQVQTPSAYLYPDMVPGNNALLRRSASRRLFHHYLHRTNKAIAICWDQKNPFIAELIPLALSHHVVLDALLACSGIHMVDGTLTSVDETTWVHYGQAIQGQKFGLTQLAQGKVEMLIPLLVTAMLLCLVESLKSESESGFLALYHLKAARALVRTSLLLATSKNQKSSQPCDAAAAAAAPTLAHFLLERYTYTMILAHITMGTEADQWVLSDTTLLFDKMRAESSSSTLTTTASLGMYGCVHELFEFIPRVSICARKRHGMLLTTDDDDDDEYTSLINSISSWEPRSGNDETYSLCGRVYQHALLVYLYSSSPSPIMDAYNHDYYTAAVQSSFDRFIPLIDSIPLESPISTSLCWPLAIFGSCARTAPHRDFIRGRLNALSTRYAAPSVKGTRSLLEKMWGLTTARRDDGDDDDDEGDTECRLPANPVSFDKLMKREGMIVLFF